MWQHCIHPRQATWLAAAVAIGISGAGVAQAGSVALGTSGWTATFPDNFDSVALTVQGQDATTVYIRKTATFGTFDFLPIVFQQTSATALPRIAIESEGLTNNTGSAWGGFQWAILGSSTGTDADAQFNVTDSNLGQPTGFSIAPFTDFAFTDNSGTGSASQPLVLTVSGGGTVANGALYEPGDGVGDGSLVINAAPNASGDYTFALKERPTTGETPPPNVIPLPAAVWSGLSSLLGLGAIGLFRRSRHTPAE
jgi:hypothetical protein